MESHRLTLISNTPSRYPTRRRTSFTALRALQSLSLIAKPPRIRMSRTWTGSNLSWPSQQSHRRSAHHMAMTSRRSLLTMQRLYAICLLNSARGAAVSFSRVVTLALAVGLVFQMTGRRGGNLSRCSRHPVSHFSVLLWLVLAKLGFTGGL
jgi:hypothetical protein